MAAISYRSRNFLHNKSINAVLPEPTGPPTPTRKGPWGCFILRLSLSAGNRASAIAPVLFGAGAP
jgi:hypothetical protein